MFGESAWRVIVTALTLRRHLFMSNRHHDRIKTIIHAAKSPTVGFLAVAFPQLKFHMTYQMRKTVPPNEPDRPPDYRRECALVVHQPVDTAVFHGILTTLPLKCWPMEKVKEVLKGPRMGQSKVDAGWNRTNGAAVNGTNGVVHVKQENTGSGSVPPAEEPKLSIVGLVNGITDIRFLPAGRLVDRKRANLAARYYHRLPTELSLRLEFTQDDRTVQCTLYELSQLFKQQTGKPATPADTQMRLWCNDVSTRVYHALVLAVSALEPSLSVAKVQPRRYAASSPTPITTCASSSTSIEEKTSPFPASKTSSPSPSAYSPTCGAKYQHHDETSEGNATRIRCST